jgi:exopolysaccharide biosynthesis polyprenyl glycosylphosphotransferase
MKKSDLAFTAILVPLDYLLVFAAALTARSLRFGALAGIRPAIVTIPFSDFLGFSAIAATVFVLCFAVAGLYGVSGPRKLKSEISRILLASSTAIMAVIVLIFFDGALFASRFIVLAAWILAFLYVAAGRIVVRFIQRLLIRVGIGTNKVAVVGSEDRTTKLLVQEFKKNPAIGYVTVRQVPNFDDAAVADLDALSKSGGLDEILVTDPDIDRETLERILGFAQSHHVVFRYSADLLATHAKNIDIGALAGVPIIEIKGTRLDGWGRIFKRISDFIVSALLIIITSPIMLVTAIAIALDSKGPIFFTTLDDGTPVTRVGEHGAPFRYFKFRSMRPKTHSLRYGELSRLDTRSDGPLVKIKNDPRVTRVGRFIRTWSVDELPELFLVLMGKMSLVGPRPHLPEEVAKYDDRQRRVLTIKPGITGMAQVSGRADLTFDEEVRLDTYYIENWSPWLDLAILLRTPLVVLAHKGAS